MMRQMRERRTATPWRRRVGLLLAPCVLLALLNTSMAGA
jgi:hypothetical protein